MQDGGVHVIDVNRISCNIITVVIGRSVHMTTLHACLGHPDTEATTMVITTVSKATLRIGRPPEFSTPDDECLPKEAPLLKIVYERC